MPVPVDDEIDRVMAIMSKAFDPRFNEAWNRRQVTDSLVIGKCHCALIDPDGREFAHGSGQPGDAERMAAGFYLSRSAFDEEELLLLAVDPVHRRRGLGARLVDNFVAAARRRGARRLFLEMRRNNPAQRLYAGLGFRPVGVRPGYYRTADGPLDAISFERILA